MLFGLVGWLLKVVGPFLWATCCDCNYPFSLISVGIRSIVVLCCCSFVPCDCQVCGHRHVHQLHLLTNQCLHNAHLNHLMSYRKITLPVCVRLQHAGTGVACQQLWWRLSLRVEERARPRQRGGTRGRRRAGAASRRCTAGGTCGGTPAGSSRCRRLGTPAEAKIDSHQKCPCRRCSSSSSS